MLNNIKWLIISTATLMLTNNLSAQRKADWTAELPASANTIFFHSLTGVPIFQGDDYFAGLDIATQKVNWTVKRSGFKAVTAALGDAATDDFFEVANSPFAVVNHTILDTRDGKILLDKEKDAYKKVNDYEILPDLNAILFRTSGDGQMRFHLLDQKTGAKKWSSNVFKANSGMSNLLANSQSKNQPPLSNIVPTFTSPVVQTNQYLILQNKTEVATLKVSDGTVLWREKLNPARVFFTEDEKIGFFIEHDKGGMIAQALAEGTKRMGKELTALDIATGKPIWAKPIEADERIKRYDLRDNQILLVHAKGCNFYSLVDGKKLWKDGFEAKNIASVVANTEGYLVSFGYYKTMQLDKSGKKMWKKAQYNKPNDIEVDIDEEAEYVKYDYDNGSLFLYLDRLSFFPKKNATLKPFSMSFPPEAKLSYDENGKTLIVFNNNGITLVNPDKYPKGMLSKNPKTDFSAIQFIEIREKGYYFSGEEDFVIVSPEGNIIERHYKEPFDGKGFMRGAISTALSVGSAVNAIGGYTNAMKGAGNLMVGMVGGSESMAQEGDKQIRKADRQMSNAQTMAAVADFIPPARHSAFSQTRDFGYFFTKDKKSGEKVLVKLNKDTGEEVDKLIFNDARPVYKADDIENRVFYVDKKQIQVFEPKR
jgi:outer membrane protein assembly factor BamB